MPFQDDLTYASKKEASQHEGTPQVPHTHTHSIYVLQIGKQQIFILKASNTCEKKQP